MNISVDPNYCSHNGFAAAFINDAKGKKLKTILNNEASIQNILKFTRKVEKAAHFIVPDKFSLDRTISENEFKEQVTLLAVPAEIFTVSYIMHGENNAGQYITMPELILAYKSRYYDSDDGWCDELSIVVATYGSGQLFFLNSGIYTLVKKSSGLFSLELSSVDDLMWETSKKSIPEKTRIPHLMQRFQIVLKLLKTLNQPSIDGLQPYLTLRPNVEPRRLSNTQRRKGILPEFEAKTLILCKPTQMPAMSHLRHVITGQPHGERIKQRQHFRRGHVRRLKDGRIIPVRPCIAGDPELGRLEKDYKVLDGSI